MFERVFSVFIFVLYLFDTVFAPAEEHNKGKGELRLLLQIQVNRQSMRTVELDKQSTGVPSSSETRLPHLSICNGVISDSETSRPHW